MGLGGVLALDQIIKTVINLSIILNHIHFYQNCFLSSCLNTRVGTDKRKLNLHTKTIQFSAHWGIWITAIKASLDFRHLTLPVDSPRPSSNIPTLPIWLFLLSVSEL